MGQAKRAVTADGDKIKGLRVAKGWKAEDLAARTGLNLKTVRTAEAGKGVDVSSLGLIATAFSVEVGELMPQAAPSPKRVTRPITISEDFDKFMQENCQDVLVQKLSQAIDALNEIIVHVVRKGSVILEIEMSEDDWRKFDAAFRDGKLAALGITHVGEVQAHPPIPPETRSITRFITRIDLNPRRFARVAAYAYILVIAPVIWFMASVDITRQKAIRISMQVNMQDLGPDPFGTVSRQARDWQIIEITTVLYVIIFIYVLFVKKK